MIIGIVGLGVVGSALQYGFEKLGHKVKVHDIVLDTKLKDMLNATVIYICVPTPATDAGHCDVSIVEGVVDELNTLRYQGAVAIKSTVVPGTTQRLIKKYPELKVCFVPEFLRERCAVSDFMENHDLLLVGTESYVVYDNVCYSHGKYPNKIIKVTPTEAELCKYFNNTFNASMVVFANSFYEICEHMGANYTKIKNAVSNRNHIPGNYLDCNDNFRGFGGVCLPKDTTALAAVCRDEKLNVDFFQMLLDENAKYRTTVYDGMRKE